MGDPDPAVDLLTLPDKPFLNILEMLSVKDNLLLAASCRTIHRRLWSDLLAPSLFAEVTEGDYGSPLIDPNGNNVCEAASSFFYFLRCARGLLKKLHVPSAFLAHVTSSELGKFPVMSLLEIDVVVEEAALSALANTIFRRIPDLVTVTLHCGDMPLPEWDSDLTALFATIGSYCPRLENVGLIEWRTVKTDNPNDPATRGIGEKLEKVLVKKLFRRLRRLSGLNFKASRLSNIFMKDILELHNVYSGLQRFHSSAGLDPGHLSGLSRCANLRYIHHISHEPINPDMFTGLRNLEHLHLVSDNSGSDPGLVDVIGDPCRSLKRVALEFEGIDNVADNVAKKLISTHPHLEAIVLIDGNDDLNDISLAGMENLKELRAISCQSAAITGSFLDTLSQPTKQPVPTRTTITGNIADALAQPSNEAAVAEGPEGDYGSPLMDSSGNNVSESSTTSLAANSTTTAITRNFMDPPQRSNEPPRTATTATTTGHFLNPAQATNDRATSKSNPALELVIAGASEHVSSSYGSLENRLGKRGQRVFQFRHATSSGDELSREDLGRRIEAYNRDKREKTLMAGCSDLLCCLEWHTS